MSNSKTVILVASDKNPRGIPRYNPGNGLKSRQPNVSEYKAVYKRWPFQKPRTAIRPRINTIHIDSPYQSKTTYRADYTTPKLSTTEKKEKKKQQKVKIPQDEIPLKQMKERRTTYTSDYCPKEIPKRKLHVGEKYKPTASIFSAKSVYQASYTPYSPDVMKNSKPKMITPYSTGFPSNYDRKQFEISQQGDVGKDKTRQTTKPLEPEKEVQKVCENIPEKVQNIPEKVKNIPEKVKSIPEKVMNMDIDPTLLSTYMDDYKPHLNAKMRNPCKPEESNYGKQFLFDGTTMYGSDYKPWPVTKLEIPPWSKRGVYKPPIEGMALNSTYSMDFTNPKVIKKFALVKPPPTKDDIILQSSKDKFAFNTTTTYKTTFKGWKEVEPAQTCKKEVVYHTPKYRMNHESTTMSSYKGQTAPRTQIIRHASEHRELDKDAKMQFSTTYSDSYRVFRPLSCPGRTQSSKTCSDVKKAWEDNLTTKKHLNTSYDSGIDMIECDNQEDYDG